MTPHATEVLARISRVLTTAGWSLDLHALGGSWDGDGEATLDRADGLLSLMVWADAEGHTTVTTSEGERPPHIEHHRGHFGDALLVALEAVARWSEVKLARMLPVLGGHFIHEHYPELRPDWRGCYGETAGLAVTSSDVPTCSGSFTIQR